MMHHIAVIGSSDNTIEFYKALGFQIDNRRKRPDKGDELVWMKGFGIYIELFLYGSHPKRADNPENCGASHLAFLVDNLDEMLHKLNGYKQDQVIVGHTGMRTCFVYAPEGTPIELKELIQKTT